MPTPPLPPKGKCAKCGQENTNLFADAHVADSVPDYCADCARVRARATPFPGTGCDRCGAAGPTFRDASHRRNEYLCARCHGEDGYAHGARQLAPDIERKGYTLPGRTTEPCELAGYGTDCRGVIKPRGGKHAGRTLCTFHANPTLSRRE